MLKNVYILKACYESGEEVTLKFEDRGEALIEMEYFNENKSFFKRGSRLESVEVADEATPLMIATNGKLIDDYANQFEALENHKSMYFEEWTLEEWLKDNYIAFNSVRELFKNELFNELLVNETTDLFLILSSGVMKKAVDAGMLPREENPFNSSQLS